MRALTVPEVVPGSAPTNGEVPAVGGGAAVAGVDGGTAAAAGAADG